MKLIKTEEIGDDLLVTFRTWFGNTYQYRGNGTVWHQYPTGQRASTSMEYRLSSIEQMRNWEREARK